MSRLHILLIGDGERDEFRAAVDDLPRWGRLAGVGNVQAAIARLAAGAAPPDVIVLAQTLPDEFPAEAVERLRRLAPLARVVGLLGSWCEGEMRSGHPWPAAIRVYWHQWFDRAVPQLAALAADEPSVWTLPSTATEEERMLAEWGRSPRPAGHPDLVTATRPGFAPAPGRLIAVATPEAAMADWLLDALATVGYAAVWWQPGHPPRVEGIAAGLFDMADCRTSDLRQLASFRREIGAVAADAPTGRRAPASVSSADATPPNPAPQRAPPIVALMHFPRPHEIAAVRRAGAAEVISKPFTLSALVSRLRGNWNPRPSQAAAAGDTRSD